MFNFQPQQPSSRTSLANETAKRNLHQSLCYSFTTKCIIVGALVVEKRRILRGEVSLSLLAAGDVLMLEPYQF